MHRDPKLAGKDFGYGSPDSGFRSMATNLKCTDTHYFPNQPSPGFASKAPQIMPVEGVCYPNLKHGIYAKANVLYGSWQIPEILPRDLARPDIEHFLKMEVPAHRQQLLVSIALVTLVSGAQEPPSIRLQRHAATPHRTSDRCLGHKNNPAARHHAT